VYSRIVFSLLKKIQRSETDIPSMAVYSREFVSRFIISYGFYERHYIRELFKFLERKDVLTHEKTCLDIGANIGNHSVRFSQIFRQVYAFEPHPRNYLLLKANSMLRSNINTIETALGSRHSRANMSFNMENMGQSSIAKRVGDYNIEVEIDTLDNFVHKHDIDDIALIKLDVEGHEEDVLKGAFETLNNQKPIVVMECLPDDIVNGSSSSIKMLQSMGYRSFYSIEEAKKNWLQAKFNRLFRSIDNNKIETIDITSYIDTLHNKEYPMIVCVCD
jgi:FkbM family methyltransferase